MDSLDAYLDELVAHLECDPLRRDEIRLELHLHLAEMVAKREAGGRDAAAAVQAAIEAFGPAEVVARQLAAANRNVAPRRGPVVTPRRLWGMMLAWVAAPMFFFLPQLLFSLIVPRQGQPSFSAGRLAIVGAERVLEGLFIVLAIWLISRRPWDAMWVCVGNFLVNLAPMLLSLSVMNARGPVNGWTMSAELTLWAVHTIALFAAAALAAWLLSRKAKPRPNSAQGSPQPAGPPGIAALDAYVGEVVGALEAEPLWRDELRFELHSALRRAAETNRQRGMTEADAAATALGERGSSSEFARRLMVASAPAFHITGARRGGAVLVAAASSCAVLLVVNALSSAAEYWLFTAHATSGSPQFGNSLFHSAAHMANLLVAGGVGSWIAWLIGRRPWDGLLACGLAFGVLLAIDRFPGVDFYSWISFLQLLHYLGAAVAIAVYLWQRQAPGEAVGAVADGD